MHGKEESRDFCIRGKGSGAVVMMRSVGIQTLVIHLPRGLRTNAFWATSDRVTPYPTSRIANRTIARRLRTAFDIEMQRYLSDQFFGAVERRAVTPGECSVSMGVEAARQALTTAELSAGEVDCLIAVSIFPDRVGVGDAGFIARELDHRGGAFNVEATCAGSLTALLVACALVASGVRSRVLVVVTNVLSRAVDISDVGSRLCGDAAAAFIVGPVADGFGLLGAETVHTGETCGNGTWLLDTVPDAGGTTDGGRRIRLRMDPSFMHVLRASAEPYLRRACDGALKSAGMSIEDVDFFVGSTPTAWHAAFSARVLGIEGSRSIDTFPQYANIGPAAVPVNMYTAASEGRIRPGHVVLLYTWGGLAEACATVLRWPEVTLGPTPEPPAVIDAKARDIS